LIFDCDDWNIREDPKYYLGFFPSSKMEFLTKKMARRADLCIAASVFLKDFLTPFARRIEYLPTGVDTGFFDPQTNKVSQDTSVVLGWVGTAYHEDMYFNLKCLLEMFFTLAQDDDRIVLMMAGEGRYFKKIKIDAENSRFKERVKIKDWVAPDLMPAFFRGIDIGLLPLIQKTRFNRAKSPTKLFEYMAMAKPTVSSNIGEAGRIIKDGVNGFLADTPQEFLKKLKILIDDPGLRQALGGAAREDAVRDYSLEVLGKRLSDSIRGL
jgi:glycosyltransferase involved in cell wall biosynthesis